MEMQEFHDRLLKLRFVDRDQVPTLPTDAWLAFRSDPYRFFGACRVDYREAIWQATEARG